MKPLTSKWRCRSCGKELEKDKVEFISNGIPLCKICLKKWLDDNPDKKGGK